MNSPIFEAYFEKNKKLSLMYKIKLVLTCFLAWFLMAAGFSQTREITGEVVNSADNNGLSSVSVNLKGTNQGTTTSSDGSFSLRVPDKEVTLVFSSVGYTTVDLVVPRSQANVTIALVASTTQLSEVVVTAMGIERKSNSLTYSTQSVKGSDLTEVKDANVMNSLIGKVSGLQINRSSSGVGGSVNITLRGLKSLRNNQPLYVIDGLPMVNNAGSGPTGPFGGSTDQGDILSTLNPDDIESINVLKGASASALYGSEGANGAIMITTKKGKAGSTKVDISSSTMLDNAFMVPELQFKYAQGANPNTDPGVDTEESWGKPGNFKDHVKGFFNTGVTLINSVSLSGGNEKIQNYFSYANTDNHGIMPTSTFKQNTLTFRNTGKFFNDKLTFDANIMYAVQKVHNRPEAGLYFGVLPGLYMFPRGLDFDNFKQNYQYMSPTRNLFLQNWFEINFDKGLSGTHHSQNPFWVLNKDPNDQTRHNIISAATLKYAVTDWLSLSARGTLNQVWNQFERRSFAGTQGVIGGQLSTALPVDNGRWQRDESSGRELYGDILLSGNRDISEDFALNFTLGSSITDFKNSGWSLDARKLASANAFLMNAVFRGEPNSINGWTESFSRFQKQAVFGSANIGFKDMVYLDLTGRNDWSSTLANTPSEKSGFFYYSAGASFVLNQMLQLPSWNNLSKLRVTYAKVGNDIAQFASITPQATFGNGTISINNSGKFGDEPLKPEESTSIELGYEGRFINNKLSVDIALYKSHTKNQYVSFSGPPGLLNGTLFLNAGNVENKGIEVSLSYNVLRSEKFGWTTSANFTANRNKIIELHPKLGNTYPVGGNYNVLRVGGSFGDLWARTFRRDDNGKIIVTDAGAPLSGPDGFIGSSNPKSLIGWGNTFSRDKLSLIVNIDGRFGGQVISTTMGYLNSFGYSKESADARDAGGVKVDAVNQSGQHISEVPAQAWYQGVGNRDGIIEGQVYSATNVRLRDVALVYRFALHSNTVKSLSVGLIGKNLFFFKNNAPFDPELSTSTATGNAGYDNFGLPSTRSYGLTVKLSF